MNRVRSNRVVWILKVDLVISDAAAFRRVHDLSRSYLLRCALRVLHNRELAEEALQEAYVAIWEGIVGYDAEVSALKTWMSAIVRNKAIDVLRREHAHWVMAANGESTAEAIPDFRPTPQEACESQQIVDATRSVIGKLRDSQRQALLLVYGQEMSHPDAAAAMGLPLGTVKTHVRRGLFNVRVAMGECPPALDHFQAAHTGRAPSA